MNTSNAMHLYRPCKLDFVENEKLSKTCCWFSFLHRPYQALYLGHPAICGLQVGVSPGHRGSKPRLYKYLVPGKQRVRSRWHMALTQMTVVPKTMLGTDDRRLLGYSYWTAENVNLSMAHTELIC